jgi:hypothetical protein
MHSHRHQPRRSRRHHLPDQRRLLKTVLQTALDEEMSEHLGYEEGERAAARTGTHRNGSSPKAVRTEVGPVELAGCRSCPAGGWGCRVAPRRGAMSEHEPSRGERWWVLRAHADVCESRRRAGHPAFLPARMPPAGYPGAGGRTGSTPVSPTRSGPVRSSRTGPFACPRDYTGDYLPVNRKMRSIAVAPSSNTRSWCR